PDAAGVAVRQVSPPQVWTAMLRRSHIVTVAVLAIAWLVWPLAPRWSATLPDFASSPLEHRRIVGFSADHATLFTDCYPPQSDRYLLQRWSVQNGNILGETA